MTDYKTYIQSKMWREKRYAFLTSKLYHGCEVCGTYLDIQVHHKTYKRLGNERLSDLVGVCKTCHKLAHWYVNTTKTLTLWNIIKKMRRIYQKTGNLKGVVENLEKRVLDKLN